MIPWRRHNTALVTRQHMVPSPYISTLPLLNHSILITLHLLYHSVLIILYLANLHLLYPSILITLQPHTSWITVYWLPYTYTLFMSNVQTYTKVISAWISFNWVTGLWVNDLKRDVLSTDGYFVVSANCQIVSHNQAKFSDKFSITNLTFKWRLLQGSNISPVSSQAPNCSLTFYLISSPGRWKQQRKTDTFFCRMIVNAHNWKFFNVIFLIFEQ